MIGTLLVLVTLMQTPTVLDATEQSVLVSAVAAHRQHDAGLHDRKMVELAAGGVATPTQPLTLTNAQRRRIDDLRAWLDDSQVAELDRQIERLRAQRKRLRPQEPAVSKP